MCSDGPGSSPSPDTGDSAHASGSPDTDDVAHASGIIWFDVFAWVASSLA